MGIDFYAHSRVRVVPSSSIAVEDAIVVADKDAYVATKYTESSIAGSSYDGYYEFCIELERILGYNAMPAPLHGAILKNEECVAYLKELDRARHVFVPKGWEPDAAVFANYTNHRYNATYPDLHPRSWFFREFYSALHLAANGGIVVIG